MEFEALRSELEALFQVGVQEPLSPSTFDELALRVFAFQFHACPPYRAFCEGRGATPDRVSRWQDVPAVPATAFKHVELVSGPPESVERVFRTSGTSAGRGARGAHHVRSLSLYRASLLPTFRAFVVPEPERLPLLSLVPSPDMRPDSSLSVMVGAVSEEFASSTDWMTDEDGLPDVHRFLARARTREEEGRPVLVVGTAFACVHLLDRLAEEGDAVRLPPGSRVMETGGFKGRSRVVSREALHESVQRLLGIPPERVVNEYGMTELLSQMYEPVSIEGALHERHHRGPPWLRAHVLDPETLAELPRGEPGLLAFFDLANLGSVSHVLTEDVGTITEHGLRLRGRAEGSEPRGCSLAVEELLNSGGTAL